MVFESIKVQHWNFTDILLPADMDKIREWSSELLMKNGGGSTMRPMYWWWMFDLYNRLI